MGGKGKVTFIYQNESGDVQTGLSTVYLCSAGSTPSGPSATLMSDADSNGTYIVDIEDDGITPGLYDIYAEGVLEIEDFLVISKDTLDDVTAHGVSITDHDSSIAALIVDVADITADIDNISGTLSSIISDVASLTGSLNTHISDTSDPHGSSLTQTTLISSDIRGASGDSEVKIQGKDGSNPIDVVIENYGSPSGYTADLVISKGDLKLGDSNTVLYKNGSNGLVLDISRGAESKFYIINSNVSYDSKVIIDGGLSADVDEVVTARGGYSNLNTRLNNITSGGAVIAHIFSNFPTLIGNNDSDDIGTANRIMCQYILLPTYLSINRIKIQCAVEDTGNHSDFGLYNADGELVLSTGGAIAITIGANSISLSSTYLIPPGEYYLAWTSSATTAQLKGYLDDLQLLQRVGYLTGGGTTLPDKITPSNITITPVAFPYMILDSASF
jgi:hypothetical protein